MSIAARWPGYEQMPNAHPSWFINALDWQTRNPLKPIPFEALIPAESLTNPFVSHLNKRDVRQILPMLGYVTGLHFKVYAVADHLAGFIFFGLLAHVIRKITQDSGVAVITTVAYALSYAGAHFFEDYYLGDGVAIVCLLGTIATRRTVFICPLVSLAAMVDERALFASALTILFWQIEARQVSPTAQSRAVFAAWLVFLAWRLVAFGLGLSAGTSDIATLRVLIHHANGYPWNILGTFGWLSAIIAVAFFVTWARRGKIGVVAGLVVCAFSLAPAFLVFDIQRSLSYGVVLLLVSLMICQRYQPSAVRFAALVGLVGNLLFTGVPDVAFRLFWHVRSYGLVWSIDL